MSELVPTGMCGSDVANVRGMRLVADGEAGISLRTPSGSRLLASADEVSGMTIVQDQQDTSGQLPTEALLVTLTENRALLIKVREWLPALRWRTGSPALDYAGFTDFARTMGVGLAPQVGDPSTVPPGLEVEVISPVTDRSHLTYALLAIAGTVGVLTAAVTHVPLVWLVAVLLLASSVCLQLFHRIRDRRAFFSFEPPPNATRVVASLEEAYLSDS